MSCALADLRADGGWEESAADIAAYCRRIADMSTDEWSSLIVVRVGFDEEMVERFEVCCVSLKSRMSGELVRIDVHLVDNMAASSFFRAALSEKLSPLVVSGGCVFNELPEGVIIMRGNERNAEDVSRHGDSLEAKRS
jgi:hypothetical protein